MTLPQQEPPTPTQVRARREAIWRSLETAKQSRAGGASCQYCGRHAAAVGGLCQGCEDKRVELRRDFAASVVAGAVVQPRPMTHAVEAGGFTSARTIAKTPEVLERTYRSPYPEDRE